MLDWRRPAEVRSPSKFPQVKELYGPLLAVVTASKSAFDAMVKQHSKDRSVKSFISAAQTTPESQEGQTYRCLDF